jgi:hypothetical protein
MTRKDYKLLAEVFRNTNPRIDAHVKDRGRERMWSDLLTKTMFALKKDNPQFDEAKFMEAACA